MVNLKYYDKAFQAEANVWWRSLSMNDWKALKIKYGFTFNHAGQTCFLDSTPSRIAEIYDKEIVAVLREQA
jgi:hypothetical protein